MKLISPKFLYAYFFVFPLSLTFVDFVRVYDGFSKETIAIIAVGVCSFYFSLLISWFLNRRVVFGRYSESDCEVSISYERCVWFLLFFGGMGSAFLALEFVGVGGLPLFMSDFETARFGLQINGYVHLLAINTGLVGALSLLASIYFEGKNKLFLRSLGVFFLVMVFLAGNRSDVFLPLLVMFSYLYIEGIIRPNLKTLLIVLLSLIVLGALKHLRDFGAGGHDYLFMIDGQFSKDWGVFGYSIYPIYMTLTYSFEIFDRLVGLGSIEHTSGAFTFYSVLSLAPGPQESFGEYKNWLLGIEFYSGLTSTYLSNLYVDFGLNGVAFGSFFIGFIYQTIYMQMKSCLWKLVYAVLISRIALSFYVFPFEQFSSIWQLFFVVLFSKVVFYNEN